MDRTVYIVYSTESLVISAGAEQADESDAFPVISYYIHKVYNIRRS
jgi:hypothetical protein